MNLPLTLRADPRGPREELELLPDVPVPAGDPVPAPVARGVVWAAAAVLLRYPDAGFVAALPALRVALQDVAGRAEEGAAGLALPVVDRLAAQPLLESQQEYVATFDTKRRCCPYLTYYLHGDTRRRGLALWRVKAALAACGLEPAHGELPDHLAVLCELAATGDESVATALIGEHRAGLTLLRAALDQAGSGYARVVQAVEALLPDGDAATALAAAAHLAASGPPAELVGLPGHLAPFLPGGHAADDSADQRGARR